jgi:hypothetical protein
MPRRLENISALLEAKRTSSYFVRLQKPRPPSLSSVQWTGSLTRKYAKVSWGTPSR